MMPTEWLPVLMQGSFNEIYVMDCDTLRFVHVNEAARMNLQYSTEALADMTLLDLAPGLSANGFEGILASLRCGTTSCVMLESNHKRQDRSSYPIELRLLYAPSPTAPAFIAVGNDISSQRESAEALGLSESRYLAIVSNTPGLVYQFLLRQDGSMAFPYLSEGCHALLGMGGDRLHAHPALFMELILPDDRASYLHSMCISAAEMTSWNWEGRIWVEEWKDTKWINLRATPRPVADHGVLWEGIMTNITQSKLEELEIKHSRARLAELSAHVEQVKEQERTRIAREIHDDLGGNLTAIKMALALLVRRLPAGDTVLIEKARYVDQLTDRTIEAAHRISRDLRPSILDFGIVAAIEWQAKEFELQLGIPCQFSSEQEEFDLQPDQAAALFRIFQEALTNIAKHAHASRVSVLLAKTNQDLSLKIADNGRGITTTDRLKPHSFGIRGMIERAKVLGGDLSVGPGPAGGSLVTICIPLNNTGPQNAK